MGRAAENQGALRGEMGAGAGGWGVGGGSRQGRLCLGYRARRLAVGGERAGE